MKRLKKFLRYLRWLRGYRTKNSAVIGRLTDCDFPEEIGAYSYVGKNCNITRAQIGPYCSIANNVSIGQGEHDVNALSLNSIFYQDALTELTSKNCEIEPDVWIGSDAVILRGVTIGMSSVIGANAVVTKNIPPFSIAVGVPAKVISTRLTEQKRQKLLSSKWWEHEPDTARLLLQEIE